MNTPLNRTETGPTEPVSAENEGQVVAASPVVPCSAYDREHGDEVEAARREFAAQWEASAASPERRARKD